MRSVGDHASIEPEIDAPVCPEFSNESVTGPSRTTERSVMSPEQIGRCALFSQRKHTRNSAHQFCTVMFTFALRPELFAGSYATLLSV